jgi:paraquat-inducible protein A
LPRGLTGNGAAATLAVLGVTLLVVGLSQPFMTMTTLGQQRDFSLVGGIAKLYADNHVGLAALLFAFSVVFPFAKLLALLVATSTLANLSMRTRRALHKAAELTGKYSLLDVLVIAVLVVLIKFKGVAEVEPKAGVAWFCAAVFCSMLAGLCVRLPTDSSDTSAASLTQGTLRR